MFKKNHLLKFLFFRVISVFRGLYFHSSCVVCCSVELIAKLSKTVVAGICPLVRRGGLVCLCIQQVTHAKAAHSNFSNQLKWGNFEIASVVNLYGNGWFL